MRRLLSVLAAVVWLTTLSSAHHSPAAFDLSSQVTIQGRVSRFDWANPHVYLYLTDAAGAEWLIETDGTTLLTRSGWTRDVVAVGTTVTVRANPDKQPQRHHALLISLALANGRVLVPRTSGAVSVQPAASLAGVWNGLRGFTQRRTSPTVPTPKGLAAAKAFAPTANPVASCVPHPTPFLAALPYLNEIEIRKDSVLIRSEFFHVTRTVYLDGRAHPTGGSRTNQGHSIGKWEGGTLVVDTTHFADHLLGNYLGSGAGGARDLPSGPRKHVVERYRLSDDRRRLIIDAVIEDPDYLAQPITTTMEWDYAPQLKLLPFGCDPEQGRRYLFR